MERLGLSFLQSVARRVFIGCHANFFVSVWQTRLDQTTLGRCDNWLHIVGQEMYVLPVGLTFTQTRRLAGATWTS
jgi:hypothetical protein